MTTNTRPERVRLNTPPPPIIRFTKTTRERERARSERVVCAYSILLTKTCLLLVKILVISKRYYASILTNLARRKDLAVRPGGRASPEGRA